MIEITVLVFLILLFIKPQAQERGESVLKWSLFTVAAWVGAELFMGMMIGLILMWRKMPLQSTAAIILIVILVYTAAICAALLVVGALRRKPLAAAPVAASEQIS
jgi:hypothetical protein